MKVVDAALATVLEGDAALTAAGMTGAFHGIAPEGQEFPYLVFAQLARPTRYTMGGTRIVQAVYLVKAMDQGDDQTRAQALHELVDALLTNQPLTVGDGWTHMDTKLEDEIDLPDHVSGMTYQQIGGRYRIWLTK